MKKVITGLLVLLCISALTGCGKDDVTLTNEDNDLVAEYIARSEEHTSELQSQR